MADEPYTSLFNIQILKYRLQGMADESHPQGGEFLYLLVENGEICSREPLATFRAAYFKLLKLEDDRREEADKSGDSLFEDPAFLDEVLATPQFAGAAEIPYDGAAAEEAVVAEPEAETGIDVEQDLPIDGTEESLDEAALGVTGVRPPKF